MPFDFRRRGPSRVKGIPPPGQSSRNVERLGLRAADRLDEGLERAGVGTEVESLLALVRAQEWEPGLPSCRDPRVLELVVGHSPGLVVEHAPSV